MDPGASSAREWVFRSVAFVCLLLGAVVWSMANFSGQMYCERKHLVCDGFGVERLIPLVLWPITAIVSLFIVLAAALGAPTRSRPRWVRAGMVATCVFVAHRNNLIWAAVTAGLAMWGVMGITDDLPVSRHAANSRGAARG